MNFQRPFLEFSISSSEHGNNADATLDKDVSPARLRVVAILVGDGLAIMCGCYPPRKLIPYCRGRT